ncbi:hypothetical protein RB595_005946 [Gaeumannomyces hyphopodioides]
MASPPRSPPRSLPPDATAPAREYVVPSHPPPNAYGTYPEQFYCQGDIEPLEEYEDGGFHPVHLGDTFGSEGRYRVIYKLGHGGFGTVWLCRDDRTETYVALKVLISDVASEDEPFELKLARLERSTPGWEYVAMPLNHFTVAGPNGTHHCLVLPVLGPRVSPDFWLRLAEGTDAAPILRGMARQATQAMGFLHRHGICHGDFRAANILVTLKGIDLLSEEDLMSHLGKPKPIHVRSESGSLPRGQPSYVLYAVSMAHRLGRDFLGDEIRVADFGESYYFDDPPEFLGIPEHYLPPEELLLPDIVEGDLTPTSEDDGDAAGKGHEDGQKENDASQKAAATTQASSPPPPQKSQVHMAVKGPACDLWALGCTLFEIRAQKPLFDKTAGRDDLLVEMVQLLGKLPGPMWDHQWENRRKRFDDEGNDLARLGKEEEEGEEDGQTSLEMCLSPPTTTCRPPPPSGGQGRRIIIFQNNQKAIPEAERELLADLLRSLLRYAPGERASVEEVLAHDWFKFGRAAKDPVEVVTEAAGSRGREPSSSGGDKKIV